MIKILEIDQARTTLLAWLKYLEVRSDENDWLRGLALILLAEL